MILAHSSPQLHSENDMPTPSSPFALQKMLNGCCDPSSPGWERSWNDFIQRYKRFIYFRVNGFCRAWKSPHVQKQLSDIVNDVVEIVFEKLCVEEHKTLRSFAGGDNEQAFCSWLTTICYRTSNRYLRQKWFDVVRDDEAFATREDKFTESFEASREIYETIVALLRRLPKRKTDLRERDINIFALYTFAGFSEPMLRASGCLESVGPRVVDVVVHRLRKELAPYRDSF